MSAREAEEMANAMLQNSPLPEAGKSDGRLPESGGSDNLPEEGGDEKLPEETPTGKLIMPCIEKVLFFALSLVK